VFADALVPIKPEQTARHFRFPIIDWRSARGHSPCVRGIQYGAACRVMHGGLWILDHPLSLFGTMTAERWAKARSSRRAHQQGHQYWMAVTLR
jgi:hypothetical protein